VAKYPSPFFFAINTEITQAKLYDGSISKVAKEMFLVMYAAEGVGFAAPQVGVNKRLVVYNQSGDKTKSGWMKSSWSIPKSPSFPNPKISRLKGV
jgi:peptide deformylase